jgi:hypothetical protein
VDALLVILVSGGLTAALIVATVAVGRERPWGPVIIALYPCGLLLLLQTTIGSLPGWLWISLSVAALLEFGVAVTMGLTAAGGSRLASIARSSGRRLGTIVGVVVTGCTALQTLFFMVIAIWGPPVVV